MFYTLKSKYILRGWEGMPWVLVERPQNETHALLQEEFQVLMLCDGETDLPGSLLDKTLEKTLNECEKEGIVERHEKVCPIDADQYYQYYKNRFISKIQWSITGRCNFRCRHCYLDAPDCMSGELSTEEALNLIDQMAECGVPRVDLTGGEPLVRRDFWQLVDRILSYKINIGVIQTNGWLVDEKLLDEFENCGIKPEFAISFDGVGWHDWMRGVPGAEKAALHAFRICNERGFDAYASMCLHRGNKDTLPATIKTLRSVGVSYIMVGSVDDTELWRKHSEGNAMTWHEYMEAVIPYVEWYYQAGRPIPCMKLGRVATLWSDAPGELLTIQHDGTESCLDCYLCDAARASCYITPEGRLLPCMPMTSSPQQGCFPLVQDIGLQKGLSDSYYMQFLNKRIKDLFEVNAECNACEYHYKCGGGCRADAAMGDDHNLMGCDRSMCMFWKNHYDERILKTIREAEEKYGFAESVASETM